MGERARGGGREGEIKHQINNILIGDDYTSHPLSSHVYVLKCACAISCHRDPISTALLFPPQPVHALKTTNLLFITNILLPINGFWHERSQTMLTKLHGGQRRDHADVLVICRHLISFNWYTYQCIQYSVFQKEAMSTRKNKEDFFVCWTRLLISVWSFSPTLLLCPWLIEKKTN